MASRTRMQIVKIATDPFGYRVHASEVLKHNSREKNQVSPAR